MSDHEFNILATFVTICVVYNGLFYAYMKTLKSPKPQKKEDL